MTPHWRRYLAAAAAMVVVSFLVLGGFIGFSARKAQQAEEKVAAIHERTIENRRTIERLLETVISEPEQRRVIAAALREAINGKSGQQGDQGQPGPGGSPAPTSSSVIRIVPTPNPSSTPRSTPISGPLRELLCNAVAEFCDVTASGVMTDRDVAVLFVAWLLEQ